MDSLYIRCQKKLCLKQNYLDPDCEVPPHLQSCDHCGAAYCIIERTADEGVFKKEEIYKAWCKAWDRRSNAPDNRPQWQDFIESLCQ